MAASVLGDDREDGALLLGGPGFVRFGSFGRIGQRARLSSEPTQQQANHSAGKAGVGRGDPGSSRYTYKRQ